MSEFTVRDVTPMVRADRDRWLDDLRVAVHELVIGGGLLAWGVAVSWDEYELSYDDKTLVISAKVPDAETGRPRPIAWQSEPAWAIPMQENRPSPREYLRRILHDFVTHEADESIGFREMPRACSALFLCDRPPPDRPALSSEVKRPFDPHAKEGK